MIITINGKKETTPACTVAELVASKGMDPAGLVIEHNRTIIKQDLWQAVRLQEGDSLEFLKFVGGG